MPAFLKKDLIDGLMPILLEVEVSRDPEINVDEREKTLEEELKEKM